MSLRDHLGVIGRESPLLIWSDPQELEWTEEERAWLETHPRGREHLEILPPGAHVRPEGGRDSQMVLMLWDYQVRPFEAVVWPPPLDDLFPEVVLRGLMKMLPGLRGYLGRMPRPQLDGGYYTHTVDNRPLICPLPVRGAYVMGALSGFGIMAACAAAELLTAYILDSPLPPYAADFALARFQDESYLSEISTPGGFGPL
jgi:glycine/D-amino acid oxidase-like deaminating enzyme